MTFIPESGWGIAYVGALLALWGHATMGRRFQKWVWIVLWANWILGRFIDVYAPMNFGLWVISDLLTIVALVAVRSRVSLVCAALYVAPLNFDLWTLLYGGSFDGAASVAEAVGYICMLIGWGASFDETGSLFASLRDRGWSGSRPLVSPRFSSVSTGEVPSRNLGQRNQENLPDGA